MSLSITDIISFIVALFVSCCVTAQCTLPTRSSADHALAQYLALPFPTLRSHIVPEVDLYTSLRLHCRLKPRVYSLLRHGLLPCSCACNDTCAARPAVFCKLVRAQYMCFLMQTATMGTSSMLRCGMKWHTPYYSTNPLRNRADQRMPFTGQSLKL